jgi:hypothetical protein
LERVEVGLDLDPARRSFRTDGSYLLVNRSDKPLSRVPLTGGFHWEDASWTMNGAPYKPEDRTRLFVFTPPAPLAPGDSLRVGFSYHGRYPAGITKNGSLTWNPEFVGRFVNSKEDLFSLMETVHGTDGDTVRVLAVETGLTHNVRHVFLLRARGLKFLFSNALRQARIHSEAGLPVEFKRSPKRVKGFHPELAGIPEGP